MGRAGSVWRVGFVTDGLRGAENFSAVVCALPPDILAGLKFEDMPAAAGLAALRTIPQPPPAGA